MKSFFWRFVICIVPVVFACLIIWDGFAQNRDHKVFYQMFGRNIEIKWGVDLKGGTILVYEIDTRKLEEKQKEASDGKTEGSTPGTSLELYRTATSELAEALKKRIDPTATYNIVIRPAGGEGRVEIIIPTGGEERAQKAEEVWRNLVTHMKQTWEVSRLEVPRGSIETMIEQIQTQRSEKVWKDKLFNASASWKKLMDEAGDDWRELKFAYSYEPEFIARSIAFQGSALNLARPYIYYTFVGTGQFQERARIALAAADLAGRFAAVPLGLSPANAVPAFVAAADYQEQLKVRGPLDRLRNVPEGDVKGFVEQMSLELIDVTTEKSVQNWMKKKAWNRFIDHLIQWDYLRSSLEKDLKARSKDYKAEQLDTRLAILRRDLETVPPDSFNEMIGRIQTKGSVVNQAILDALVPVVGRTPTVDGLLDRNKIEKFIKAHYGPSPEMIRRDIDAQLKTEDVEGVKDLTVEEVQRIKDLVSKVGALEFRIVANSEDDDLAIDEAKKYFENTGNSEALQRLAVNGQPPPGPTDPGSTELKSFDIKLPRSYQSKVTYSWVELGKQVRKDLGLNNKARVEPAARARWLQFENNKGKAIQLTVEGATDEKFVWQGALFYRRECKDRNLPDRERNEKQYEYFVLTRNPEIVDGEPTPRITGKYLTRATSTTQDNGPAVSFNFDNEGGEQFGTLTRKNIPSGTGSEEAKIKRHLCIILDLAIVSAPTVNSEIRNSGVITGNFTKKEVDSMVNILRSGALPASLKPEPVSESTISPTLGRDTINSGLTSIGWAFVGVLAFMLLYYRFSGIVACLALFANLVLTVGFMIFVQATFTLPGLAALVLMLGMAVDANVLIYERLREERERGANLPLALRNGYERAFPTIIDTHLSSIFTAIVLYAVGNDQLKGFGISLTVGLIISLFTSLYITRTIFDFWLDKKWLTNLAMFKLLSKPNINFMKYRHAFFSFSVFVTFAGLILFLARAPRDLDIDFKGGTAFSGQLMNEKAMTIEELRENLDSKRQAELLKVANVTELSQVEHRYQITYELAKDKPKTVRLANPPKLATKEEREQKIAELASGLPDFTVEQIHASFFTARPDRPGESPFFTVRTSEKERELVQVMIDMLFREKTNDGWVSELEIFDMEVPDFKQLEASNGKFVNITFNGHVATTIVKSLLQRELRIAFELDVQAKVPIQFEIVGEGDPQEGRYQEMKILFDPALNSDQIKKIETALVKTQRQFEQPLPERLENFDSEFAANTQMRATGAILASWLAIVLYLWFRFGSWTFGLAAMLCLVHDLCFCLGVLAFSYYLSEIPMFAAMGIVDFKIDFNGVAALLTLVGYSVADTIVVFDRIREVRGKNPMLTPQMVNESINQTLSRTVLTSGTTFIVVFILFCFGGPGVHTFAFIMSVGIIIGTFSSVYIASPLLLMFGEGKQSELSKERDRAKAQTAGATV
jgi:SecD/SecF fusion protein